MQDLLQRRARMDGNPYLLGARPDTSIV